METVKDIGAGVLSLVAVSILLAIGLKKKRR